MTKEQTIQSLFDTVLATTTARFIDPDFRNELDINFGSLYLRAIIKPHYYDDEKSLYLTVDFRTRNPHAVFSNKMLLGHFQFGKDGFDKDTGCNIHFERTSMFLHNDEYSDHQITNQCDFLEFQSLILKELTARKDELYSFISHKMQKAAEMKAAN